MNSSKSIGDLTELPEKDYATGRYSKGTFTRRSCSPLAVARSPATPCPTSSSLPNSTKSSPKRLISTPNLSIAKRSNPKFSATLYKMNNSTMKMSKSTGHKRPEVSFQGRRSVDLTESELELLPPVVVSGRHRRAHSVSIDFEMSIATADVEHAARTASSVDRETDVCFDELVTAVTSDSVNRPWDETLLSRECYVFSSASPSPTECDVRSEEFGDRSCNSPASVVSSCSVLPSSPPVPPASTQQEHTSLSSASSSLSSKPTPLSTKMHKNTITSDQSQQRQTSSTLMKKVAIQDLLPSKSETGIPLY